MVLICICWMVDSDLDTDPEFGDKYFLNFWATLFTHLILAYFQHFPFRCLLDWRDTSLHMMHFVLLIKNEFSQSFPYITSRNGHIWRWLNCFVGCKRWQRIEFQFSNFLYRTPIPILIYNLKIIGISKKNRTFQFSKISLFGNRGFLIDRSERATNDFLKGSHRHPLSYLFWQFQRIIYHDILSVFWKK